MKKSKHSRVKHLFERLFNVRAWVDFDRIRSGQRFLVDQCATYFMPGKAQKSESFDAAKARLKLSDEDVLARQQGLFRLSLIMVGAATLVFIYLLYNLYYAYYAAVLVSSVVMCLALVMAFRYHFWYFQIKHQKLGCSLREWFMQGLLGANDE